MQQFGAMTSIRDLFERAADWNAWLARVGDGRSAWEQTRADTRLAELEPEYAGIAETRYVLAVTDAGSAEAAATLPLIARAVEAAGGEAEMRLLDRREDAEAIARALGVVPARSTLCLVYDEDWTEVGRWAPWHARSAGAQEVHSAVAERRGGGPQELREFLAVLRGEPHETRHPWKTLTHHLWRQVDHARRE